MITEILPLERDPNLRRIKVNGRSIGTVRASLIEMLSLRVGTSWSPPLQQRVDEAREIDAAHQRLMAMLSRRALSAQQASEMLTRRGVRSEVVDRVVADAREHGWIDDQSLAQDIVQSAGTSRRPAGRRLIAARLRRRGIAPDAAEQAIRDVTVEQQRADAWALARKRMATLGKATPPTAIRKVAGLLQRRGFSESIIEEIVERLAGLIDDSFTQHE